MPGGGGQERGRETRLTAAGGLLGESMELFFASRHGGVSPPPFDTLNLAFHAGDEPDNVEMNRAIAAATLDIPPARFVYMQQVHSTAVKRASGDAENGSGPGQELPSCDGAFTTEPGLALCVLTADCVPVAIAVPSRGAVALLHAGWKGTIANIALESLRMIHAELGLDPGEARAVLGPAVGPCCYEVDKGRADLFVERFGRCSGVVTGRGKRSLDLRLANAINLMEAGVKEENIFRVGGCTCCDGDYFSYRRDGVTGRQGTFLFMRAWHGDERWR